MKKITLIMALVIGLGSFASAQTKTREHKTPQQRAEMMASRLQKKLNLSKDQTTKVNSIFLAQAARMDSLRANHMAHVKRDTAHVKRDKVHAKGDKQHGRYAHRDMFKNTDDQLNAVFNAEQKKAYAELKAERRKKMEAKRAEKKQG